MIQEEIEYNERQVSDRVEKKEEENLAKIQAAEDFEAASEEKRKELKDKLNNAILGSLMKANQSISLRKADLAAKEAEETAYKKAQEEEA